MTYRRILALALPCLGASALLACSSSGDHGGAGASGAGASGAGGALASSTGSSATSGSKTAGSGTGGAAISAGNGGGSGAGGGLVILQDAGDAASACTHLNIGILGNPGADPSSNFQQWLVMSGTSVQRIQTTTTDPLTAATLQPFDVVVLDWLTRDYSSAEATTFAA